MKLPQPTCSKVLQLYYLTFERLWKEPVFWDDNAEQFRYRDRLWDLRYWISTIPFSSISIISILGFMFREIFLKETDVSAMQILIFSVWLAAGAFYVNMFWVQYKYSMYFVNGWNRLQLLSQNANQALGISKRHRVTGSASKPDMISAVFYICGWCMAIFPPFLTIFTLLLNVDALFFIIRYINPTNPNVEIGLQFLRFLSLLLSFTEGCRTYQLTWCVMLSGIKTWSEMLHQIVKVGRDLDAKVVNFYWQLYSTFDECMIYLQATTTLLFGHGIVLTVLFLSISIKGYDLFPIMFYCFFPLSSAIIVVTFYFLMDIFSSLNVQSGSIIRQWSVICWDKKGRFEKALIKREIRALRPFKWVVGIGGFRFLHFQTATSAAYYMVVIEYTVSFMLAWPL